MNRKVAAVLAAMTLLCGSAWATNSLKLQPGAELSIEGKSTVRDFTCRAQKVAAEVAMGDAGEFTLEQLAAAVKSARLEVATMALDCANDTMNAHMRDALHADEHKTIAVQINRYEIGNVVDGVAPLKLHADITLNGVTKPVTIVANARVKDGALAIEGRYALRMTEWGVKPPSLMLGTMKVRESVVIRFQLAMKP